MTTWAQRWDSGSQTWQQVPLFFPLSHLSSPLFLFLFIFNFLCLGVLPPSVYLHCVCAVSEEDTTTVWGLGLNQVLGALSH